MHVGIGLVSDSILVVFLVFHTKKTTEFLVDSVDMKKHLEKYCLNYETFWMNWIHRVETPFINNNTHSSTYESYFLPLLFPPPLFEAVFCNRTFSSSRAFMVSEYSSSAAN
jgi:hypothetical protein